MLNQINVQIQGKNYNFSRGISLEEISKIVQDNYKYPILIAKVDNRLKELTEKLYVDSKVEFLDLTTKEGNRCYISGLCYTLIYACKLLYGKKGSLNILHSLDKGIYIESDFNLDKDKIKDIKNKMKDIITQDMSITKTTVDRIEAIKYFENIGDDIKANVMRYNTNSYVNLYRLGNTYNYFYNLMPSSCGVLKDFDLTYIEDNGFILQFPTIYEPDIVPKYTHHSSMFNVFNESRNWAHIMHIETTADLNKLVSTGKINDIIKISETLQNNKLLDLAQIIYSKKNRVKIILLAGPSSSGKTTTSKKLCMYLKSFGLNPIAIAMDDYFKDRVDTPVDENGEKDYECLEAVDLKLFDKTISKLLDEEEVIVPTYNFILGEKEFKNKMKLSKNDIMIIEGIHALDDKVLENIDKSKKFKIYISPLTELNIDSQNRISTTDHRLLRRMIRDNRTRGYNIEQTLDAWHKVRIGEEKYIFPYQDSADFIINSALIYEIGVLKTYVEPLLFSIDINSKYYEEAKRLINFLHLFLPITADNVPQDSILREFIGNSYFEE